jgi:tRNA threonylcarbamoyladenosine biosynthesis protein TsaB
MNVLAIDTSTEYLSLALWSEERVLTHEQLAVQAHSSLILPAVRELLERAGLRLGHLNGIAYGAGPGSFTGLRIGCGVAQGLAYGAGLSVVGICTLLALAEASGADRVIACLDARMGEVYHAAYVRQDGIWTEVHAPGVYAPETVPVVPGEGWYGVGSGWAAHGERLQRRYAGQVVATRSQTFPHAREIAVLAAPQFAHGLGRPPQEAAPLYVRNKVALTTQEQAAR